MSPGVPVVLAELDAWLRLDDAGGPVENEWAAEAQTPSKTIRRAARVIRDVLARVVEGVQAQ